MAGANSKPDIEQPDTSNNCWSVGFWTAMLAIIAVAVGAELLRPAAADNDPTRFWWAGLSPDWRPLLPLLIIGMPLWFVRQPLLSRVPRSWLRLRQWCNECCPPAGTSTPPAEALRAVALSLLVTTVAFLLSRHVANEFGDLPPAYHDEFSYLFQAQTFLAGHLSLPSHSQMPELFDQMHVLNEGQFASRYFPGVGLWLMPFVALGNPWLGYWIAHAFASFLLFWIGRHLANNLVGLIAGLLLAVSPGVVLFSNLLLGHHPTLVGLLVFVITFLKMRRAVLAMRPPWLWAMLSGCGLTYAMLCRPMTAAGVGLPFGVWFAWWTLTGQGRATSIEDRNSTDEPIRDTHPLPLRMKTAAAMAVPIVTGFVLLFVYNRAITGDALVTPYQQYTDIYTPRHVYGFNNVVRGEQHLGPKVLTHYDVWAENLTPTLAAQNLWRRLLDSVRWTLGIVPLGLAGLLFLLTIQRWNSDWWLMAAAIMSLHLVHVPYWFEGIMGWHYVFESAPFWLLIFAGVAVKHGQNCRLSGRPWMSVWWTGLIAMAVVVNLVTVEPLWPARLDVGIEEVAFSRRKYAQFDKQLQQLSNGRRVLILIQSDPTDRHIDYVVNEPTLDTRILRGRYRPGNTDLNAVVRTFADRDVWLFDVATKEVQQLSQGSEHEGGR